MSTLKPPIARSSTEKKKLASNWGKPQFIVLGEKRAALLKQLGASVFQISEFRFDEMTGEIPGAAGQTPGSGFSSVVMLIPTEELMTIETYRFVDAMWENNMRHTVPLWMTHWSGDFDMRLEKNDRTVVADALGEAIFTPPADINLGFWAGKCVLQTLPQFPKTDELLKGLVWFIEGLRTLTKRPMEAKWFRRELGLMGITSRDLKRAEQMRNAKRALVI